MTSEPGLCAVQPFTLPHPSLQTLFSRHEQPPALPTAWVLLPLLSQLPPRAAGSFLQSRDSAKRSDAVTAGCHSPGACVWSGRKTGDWLRERPPAFLLECAKGMLEALETQDAGPGLGEKRGQIHAAEKPLAKASPADLPERIGKSSRHEGPGGSRWQRGL